MQHEPGSGNGQPLRSPGSPRCCQRIHPNRVSPEPIGAGKKSWSLIDRRKQTKRLIDGSKQTSDDVERKKRTRAQRQKHFKQGQRWELRSRESRWESSRRSDAFGLLPSSANCTRAEAKKAKVHWMAERRDWNWKRQVVWMDSRKQKRMLLYTISRFKHPRKNRQPQTFEIKASNI
jgi:hypothetical protein